MKLNDFFWHNGYCIIRNFISEPEYLSILPEEGMYEDKHLEWLYDGTFDGDFLKLQVPGSYSRTCYPPLGIFINK